MRAMHLVLAVAVALGGSVFVSAQCTCQPCECRDCDCGPTYAQAYEKAVHQNLPLVVFVKQKARVVPGCVSCRWDAYPGQGVPGVAVGLPDGKGGIDEAFRRDSYPTTEWLLANIKDEQWKREQKKGALAGVGHPLWMNGAPRYRPASFEDDRNYRSPLFAPRGGCGPTG